MIANVGFTTSYHVLANGVYIKSRFLTDTRFLNSFCIEEVHKNYFKPKILKIDTTETLKKNQKVRIYT